MAGANVLAMALETTEWVIIINIDVAARGK
jgi:hypothetical protein